MPKILIDGKQCFYQDRGAGFPLLFGHSYLWTSEMWEPQLSFLSQTFRCIAPDLWGHGRSDPFPIASVEQLGDHAWKLMQSLGIDRFGVIGLSVGGMWGVELALKHPEAVQTLILMDTFMGSEPLITRARYFGMLDLLEKAGHFPAPLLDQIIPLFFSPATFHTNPELPLRFRESLASIPQEKIPGIAALGRIIFSRRDLLHKLPTLSMPSLVIVGKDDIPRPPKEAAVMASLLPESALVEIEHAGHICNLEQIDAVNQALAEFLTLQISLKALSR